MATPCGYDIPLLPNRPASIKIGWPLSMYQALRLETERAHILYQMRLRQASGSLRAGLKDSLIEKEKKGNDEGRYGHSSDELTRFTSSCREKTHLYWLLRMGGNYT